MTTSPVFLQSKFSTRDAMDAGYDHIVREGLKNDDANDELYAYSASADYNPGPELEKIRARLLAINFADDEINPPELHIYDREMPRVRDGRYIIVPPSDKTTGHSTRDALRSGEIILEGSWIRCVSLRLPDSNRQRRR
jgi:homoserine O-acetyltransferase/O-succinyltransferase